MSNVRRTVLVILDGFAFGDSKNPFNAVAKAKTPCLDSLRKECPFTELGSFGEAIGLPEGQMGNSEVGHLNIGAGRIVFQEFLRIDQSIADGSFSQRDAFKKAFAHAKKHKGRVHLFGLLGPGGVHAHERHFEATLKAVAEAGLDAVVHPICDGRDTLPRSAKEYLQTLQEQIDSAGTGIIADLVGRYYAMDRDKRWERTQKAYDLYSQGICERTASSAFEALEKCYSEGEDDEFCKPVKIVDDAHVKPGDSVLWLNFRPDRSRQMVRAFMQPDFSGFEREKIKNIFFVCMTQYDDEFLDFPQVDIAFERAKPRMTLAEHISNLGLKQFHIAETEKYAHVTYFLNGGREKPFAGEERVLIPSPKVATYDLQPEMSAKEVTDELIKAMESKKFEFLVCNYANPDMVGHTGNFPAAVKMIEFIDECLSRLVKQAKEDNYTLIITSDHGNCEEMKDKQKHMLTAHSLHKSPFIVINADVTLSEGESLANVAPTVLDIMNLSIPQEMTAKSLIKGSKQF